MPVSLKIARRSGDVSTLRSRTSLSELSRTPSTPGANTIAAPSVSPMSCWPGARRSVGAPLITPLTTMRRTPGSALAATSALIDATLLAESFTVTSAFRPRGLHDFRLEHLVQGAKAPERPRRHGDVPVQRRTGERVAVAKSSAWSASGMSFALVFTFA